MGSWSRMGLIKDKNVMADVKGDEEEEFKDGWNAILKQLPWLISTFCHDTLCTLPGVINPWYPWYLRSDPYPWLPWGWGVGFVRGRGGGMAVGTQGFTPAIP